MIKIWKTTLKLRMFAGFVFIALFGGLLFFKAFKLQVLESGKLKMLARKQFYSDIYYTPRRGNIYSADDDMLATSIEVPGIAVDPMMVRKKLKTAENLSEITGVSFRKIIKILNLHIQFAWIKRRVGEDVAVKVQKLGVGGLIIVKQPVRFYPNGSLLSHVLGFVGINDNGLSGIEYQYNKYLAGNKKGLKMLKDGLGQDIFLKGFGLRKATEGDDIYLTVNKRLQFATQYYLDKEAKETDSVGAFAIIMDPKTGAILAMADYPGFNPNRYWTYPPGYWRNRAVTDDFEPGSIMKPFVTSAGLMEGIITPDTVFNCYHGSYPIHGITINDVEKWFGNLTVSQIIEYSSNVGECQIGMKFKRKNLFDWFSKWGFGHVPHAGLPGEANGIVKPLGRWSGIGPCEMAFGQGISITGLQAIVGLSEIANGGYRVKPYIIRKIVDPYGKVIFKEKDAKLGRIISSEVDSEVKHMMRLVVKGGTGQYANLIDFKVAGKTGTGQIADPKTGKYYKNLYNASFMAFMPYSNSRLAMIVVMEKPRKIGYYGGAVSAPVVRSVFKNAINIFNIYPGEGAYDRQLSANGNGTVLQSPGNGLQETKNVLKEQARNSNPKSMPDLKGETIYQVLAALVHYNFKIKIVGTGFLYYQSIKPSTMVKKRRERLLLKFKPGNYNF